VKDRSCVDVCPVDCIYEGEDQLYIHPDECIDCGACEPECPVTATPSGDLRDLARQMREAVIEAKVAVEEIREALTHREVGQHEATSR